MAWTLQNSDTFNRADGSLEGSTMSDAVAAWGTTGETWDIVSNQAKCTTFSADRGFWADITAVADQKVEVDLHSGDSGVIARHDKTDGSTAVYYMAYVFGATVTLYKHSGSGFTSLGTAGSLTVPETIALECIGTGIKVYVSGSETGSVTDGTIASGVGGMYAGGTNGQLFDNWNFYIDSAASTARLVNGGLLFGGKLIGGGRAR